MSLFLAMTDSPTMSSYNEIKILSHLGKKRNSMFIKRSGGERNYYYVG